MRLRTNKILFLCNYASIYGGNFIPSLVALEKELKTKNYECIYVFPDEAKGRAWFKELVEQGATVDTIHFSSSKLAFLKERNTIVKKYDPSIVYAHFCSLLNMELYALLHSEKVYVHIHSDFSEGKNSIRNKMRNLFVYHVFSHTVRFISVSQKISEQNPYRITYIPNALADKRMTCKRVGGNVIREQLGIADNDVMCILLGWNPRVKGVDIATEAVNNVNNQFGRKVKLAIVVGGNCNENEMKKYIRANTSLSGNEEFIRYLPPTEDVFSYYEAADILISASRSEGFSYTILEMLSLGKRCVISDIPGVSWAKKYDGVYLFPSESINDCSLALKEAVNSNDYNEKTAFLIKQDYSISNWTKAVVEALRL